jgi:hypothetical protein
MRRQQQVDCAICSGICDGCGFRLTPKNVLKKMQSNKIEQAIK